MRLPSSRTSLRHFHGGYHLSDDLIGSQTFEVSFRFEQEAMSQNRERRGFHIVRQKVIPPIHSGESAGHKK